MATSPSGTRALWLADKLERDVPFTPSDAEPEDVTWINDATRPLIHAIAPSEAAQLALRLAEETDNRVASVAPATMWPLDPNSLLNPVRAEHRERRNEIEQDDEHRRRSDSWRVRWDEQKADK